MRPSVSKSERAYVRSGCESGIRIDGRGKLSLRSMFVENNIFPHTNGSSRIKIADATEVVCAIKCEIIEGSDVNCGRVEIGVDISPTCSLRADDRRNAELASSVAAVISNIVVASGSIDLDALTIVPGKSAWCLYIDLVVLQTDDGLYDACGLAVSVALHSTKLPKLKIVSGDTGKMDDFEVVGDLSEALPLSTSSVPLIVCVLNIGNSLIVDGSNDEWCTASSALIVGVDKEGNTCGMTKILDGAMTVQQIGSALEIAKAVAISINASLDKFYASESFERDGLFSEIPPYRIGFLS